MNREPSHLKDAGAIRSPPGVEKIVFAGRNEPFATRGKFQRKDARFVQMQLILVWLGMM